MEVLFEGCGADMDAKFWSDLQPETWLWLAIIPSFGLHQIVIGVQNANAGLALLHMRVFRRAGEG